MARKANQAIIGAFVLGAVLLAVAGVVVLGGGRFFHHTQTLVAYFDGSLEGLDIGAPVTFNGVKIGSVTDVRVVIDPRDASIRTPVFFKIDARRLHDGGGGRITLQGDFPRLELLIEHGLRARLELQSLVTGQLVVALNFYPNTPLRLTGLSKRYPEMPTIPSSFDRLTRTLEKLPIETLVAETLRTMRSIGALVSAPEVKSALGKLDQVLSDVDGLVRDVNRQIDPLITTLDKTAVATRTTMAETQAALARLTPAASAVIADHQALAQDARKLVAHADARIESLSASVQTTLADAQSVLGEDSPVRYDLADALQEMTKAARSLRTLADYLDQHPEAPGRASMRPSLAGSVVITPAIAVALLALAGCGTSPATRFYVLTPVAANDGDPSPVSDVMTIGIRSVELPEELDRPQIVTRTGANTVHIAEFDRWPASLRDSVMQLIGGNLAILLPGDRVAVYPWTPGTLVDREVIVEVTRFDGQLGGQCALHARWKVLARKGAPSAVYGQSTLSEASGRDYAALVAAQSRLLGALSAEIASAIRNGAR